MKAADYKFLEGSMVLVQLSDVVLIADYERGSGGINMVAQPSQDAIMAMAQHYREGHEGQDPTPELVEKWRSEAPGAPIALPALIGKLAAIKGELLVIEYEAEQSAVEVAVTPERIKYISRLKEKRLIQTPG